MTIIQPHNFKCKFCDKPFIKESWYLSHKCKEMLRDEVFRSPVGQAAWEHYQTWMTYQKRVVTRSETFVESKFFNSFIKFTQWAIQVGLPDKKLFVRMMVEKNISPMIWTDDEMYSIYVEYFDNRLEPIEHARISVDTIIELSDSYDCDPAELFNVVDVGMVVEKIRQRKLTPWLLLNSKTFKVMFVNRANDYQRITMQTLIRPEHWASQFKKYPDVLHQMKELIAEIGI